MKKQIRLGVIAGLQIPSLIVALSWILVEDRTSFFAVFVGLYLLAAAIPAEEGIDQTLCEGIRTSLDLVSKVLSSAMIYYDSIIQSCYC